jgi:NADPH2:quinone reductase
MTLPQHMTAIGIPTPGGPDALKPETRPLPKPGPTEILVRVAAAGVNRPDVMQRMGVYPPPPGAPDIPGLEIAGEVVAAGEKVSRWRVGDKLCALVPGGGYAEYCVADETNALPVPRGLSLIEAAALPETFFTVWYNVVQRGGLQRGETVLIHGGSSGIGTTAVMLAKALGAKVIVTAGSAEKCAACRRLGADVAINYKTEDFVAATKAATGDRGAEMIVDIVGGEYVTRNYEAAAVEGRVIQISVQAGPNANVTVGQLMRKRLTHMGSTLRPQSVAAKAAIARGLLDGAWPLIEAGRIKPVIDSTFPLADAAKAHARMESSVHIGKIVLRVSP